MAQTSGYKYSILNSDGTTSTTVADFADTFVRKELFLNSGLWAWGDNGGGLLGIGTNTGSRSSPVQVGSLINWKQVAGGSLFSSSLKSDGTLWTWGTNSSGQLGLGDITSRSSPVQVGVLSNWKLLATSCSDSSSSMVIKTDNSLWVWGDNTNGVLGLGDIINRSSPVQVGLLTNWKQVSIGNGPVLAIKTDGTLWAWGNQAYGELGQNNNTLYSSPAQVGSLANWKQVSAGGHAVLAIKYDGTLWAIGDNRYGTLGLGNITPYSSPVQVGSLTNWKQITTGHHHAVAIKTDGSLWAWGENLYGQVGTGASAVSYYSSPVQVGSLTNWKQVAGGLQHTVAVKTDGTLWSWGYNTNGELGQGNNTLYSSPVQIGSLTNWKQVSCGTTQTLSIQAPDLP
jgi:alpha-tubulin suppressor-like RCC1 family protein